MYTPILSTSNCSPAGFTAFYFTSAATLLPFTAGFTGDAYYLRDEIFIENHPVSALAAANAVDNQLRLDSLEKLRQLFKDHQSEIDMFGYHDPKEFSGVRRG